LSIKVLMLLLLPLSVHHHHVVVNVIALSRHIIP
jgi:hypothetical protein